MYPRKEQSDPANTEQVEKLLTDFQAYTTTPLKHSILNPTFFLPVFKDASPSLHRVTPKEGLTLGLAAPIG